MTVPARSSARWSTVNAMSPSTLRSNPVAVTTMSASSVAPEARRIPVSVNVSIWSVATDTLPSPIATKRSPPGSTAIRCCHGR